MFHSFTSKESPFHSAYFVLNNSCFLLLVLYLLYLLKGIFNYTLNGSSVLYVTWLFITNLLDDRITNSLAIPSFSLPVFHCQKINSKWMALHNCYFVKILSCLDTQEIFLKLFGIIRNCRDYVDFILRFLSPISISLLHVRVLRLC